LKLLYSTVKALEIYSLKSKHSGASFKKDLASKLNTTFMPIRNGLGDIVKKGQGDKFEFESTIIDNSGKYQQNIYYAFGERTETAISNCSEQVKPLSHININALFIPAKEVLTAFNDIRNIRDHDYGVGFDDTYRDLITSLDLPTTRGRIATELSQVNKTLEDLFEGRIEQTDKRELPFLFKKGKQRFAMQMTAEGIKKIGILTTLINNRQLGKGTILFMDEPETALHPDAIRQMVEMLVAMSKAGVQIFVSSHSYFLIKQFAICAKRDSLSTMCWNLNKENGIVKASFHDMQDGVLPQNTVIEEALKMFDDEIDLDLNS
jgi:hypothetical protein